MELIKIFCVTKNEYDLIEDFILYYGYLFKFTNIVIIDNNSTMKEVLKIYEKYKTLGVTVFSEASYSGTSQGEHFTKYMNMYKNTSKFLMGLDTDEFLFSVNDKENPFSKEKIHNLLNNLSLNCEIFKINSYPCSVIDTKNVNYINYKFNKPVRNIINFSNGTFVDERKLGMWKNTNKYFSKNSTFRKVSNGNHRIWSKNNIRSDSNLGLLHFNDTGIFRQYERSKQVVEGYKYCNTQDPINKQIDQLRLKNKGSGSHKVHLYKRIIMKKFLIDLFIRYIKRLPTIHELDVHVNKKIKKCLKTLVIKNEFINCPEAIKNKDKIFNFSNQKQIDDLVFYEKDIDSLNYNIYQNNFLSEALKEADKYYNNLIS